MKSTFDEFLKDTDSGHFYTFEKRGKARSVIIVDVGPAVICTLIVCETHRYTKHATIRPESEGMTTRSFENLYSQRLYLKLLILSNLSPFDILVDKGTQNILNILSASLSHAG